MLEQNRGQFWRIPCVLAYDSEQLENVTIVGNSRVLLDLEPFIGAYLNEVLPHFNRRLGKAFLDTRGIGVLLLMLNLLICQLLINILQNSENVDTFVTHHVE